MRKIGEQLENEMLKVGEITESDLRDARFVKTAMIERTMHYIQKKAELTKGERVWSPEEYDRKLKLAAANISISDIAGAGNISAKIGIIIKELKK